MLPPVSSGALSLVERLLKTTPGEKVLRYFLVTFLACWPENSSCPVPPTRAYIFPSGMLTSAETVVLHLFRGIREIRAFRLKDPAHLRKQSGKGKVR